MTDILKQHQSEIARSLRNGHYEVADNGRILLSRMGLALGGQFAIRVDGGPRILADNVVVLEARNKILNVFFNNDPAPTGFYIAPFTNNVDPSSSLTAATFTATQGEYIGYTETARVQWVPDGPSTAQSIGNVNAPARFTIGTGGATVRGAALITASAKSATTGVLVAAALFDVANTLSAGSKLDVEYTITATDD